MDEINDLGKYLRRSNESTEAKLSIPAKGGNTMSMSYPILGVMAVLVAVFVFLILFPFARGATSAGVSLGMSMTMYLVTRAAAFAGILAFLFFGVRGCLAGIDKSRGFAQRMGWGALILMVVALTLAAFTLLLFVSIADY